MLPMGIMGVSGVRYAIGALTTKPATSIISKNPATRRGAVVRHAYLQFSHRVPLGRPALSALVAVVTATALLAGAGSFAAPAGASPVPGGQAAGAGAKGRPADGSSAFDWPELHLNSQLDGYAANGTVSTANAAGLGVHWATDLYGAILDSPAIAFDSSTGQTLGYVGTDSGDFFAVDMATGNIVWSVQLAGAVQASPVVSDGAVWVGTRTSPTIYKLDATTGAVDCSQALSGGMLFSSPVAATPPGGTASVYFADLSSGNAAGKVLSISAATCATQWNFHSYQVASSSWDPLTYAIDAAGEPLLLFGSADPDAAAYAVDAVTGKQVWRFQTAADGDDDVGSGLTVSPPGANGFADGAVYVPGKDGFIYAVDLTTGTQIWKASLGSFGGTRNESLSTAAFDGTNLVVGDAIGVIDFNAVTGTPIWKYQDPTTSQISPPGPSEVISSPVISGPTGQEVVAFTDLSGAFRVLSLATGTQLYQQQTGSWISASPAVSNGDILFGSSDGFLYDMAAGSGNDTPATAITSLALGATVANPGGNQTVSGTAADSAGVAAVVVAVRQGGKDGMWWDAATSTWSATPVNEQATLTSPGATSTGWSVSFPVPPSGNAYRVDAYAVSVDGPSARPAADDEFFVSPAAAGPTLTVSPGFAAPAATVSVSGSGFGPGETVNISLLGTVLGQATSGADGSLPTTQVTLPASAGFGPTALVATGATSGASAAAGIDVTSSWSQLGGGPGRTGFEPNDPVITDTISPGDSIVLDPAWHFAAGSPLTPPTVVDQVAYVGDRKGILHALQARDGTPLWTWHTPNGAAVTGAPAVDAAAGLAFVGTAKGTMYAVFTSGSSAGTLAWSSSLGGGSIQSPAFDGTDVYAASTSGKVVKLAESTGTGVWSATVAGVSTAPSLDPAGGVLAVPASSGVTALSTATGTSLWSFAAPGATSPMLAAGTMYVGSSNDNVYAVSESTGQQIWSTPTGGAIQDSGALSLSSTGSVTGLFVGSADGRLYFLNPSTGAVQRHTSLGGSAHGLAMAGNMIFAAPTGVMEGVRTFGELVFAYGTKDGQLRPPAVVNGTCFVTGQNGALWALTPYGEPPQ
jgi:outer membrane protein assembly factor BamB